MSCWAADVRWEGDGTTREGWLMGPIQTNGPQGQREGTPGATAHPAGRISLASGPCSAWAAQLGLEVASSALRSARQRWTRCSRGSSLALRLSAWCKGHPAGRAFSHGIRWLSHSGEERGRNFFQNNSERPKNQASRFQTSTLSSAMLIPRPPGPPFPLSTIVPMY